MAAAFAALASRAAVDQPSSGRGPAALRQDASDTLACLATALLGAGHGPLHLRLAARFERPAAAEDLRRALVLLADHELNASTFAVRVTVSTGASLAAGALTGLAALSGPMHGLAARAVAALADEFAGDQDPADILRDWLGEGRNVPGFGHRLYPAGDIRATELLAHLDVPPAYASLRQAADEVLGEMPNVDFALAALTQVHDLPHEAPLTIFALARSVGWLAHMLEQAASGQLIRPRARYTGPKP
jgi:citrate synthase